jgi:hypothetical protein
MSATGEEAPPFPLVKVGCQTIGISSGAVKRT